MAFTVETERTILWCFVIASVVGACLMLISITTDYWVIVNIPNGTYRNVTGGYVFRHHSGLWRICRSELHNDTGHVTIKNYCSSIKLFVREGDPEVDENIMNYSRSETAFAVIGLFLLALAVLFAIYAIKNPRYMFKRLVAILYFMAAICVVISIEVLISSVNYEKENLPARHPEGATSRWGFSFVLMWLAFVVAVLSGLVFLFFGRKRKGEQALSEREAMENEPINIGR